jgi:hypothetical protein
MLKRAMTVTLATIVVLFAGLETIEVSANPDWGKPATPIPPIKDPPQIIINSPYPTVYGNPVPLNITIIQPDSWVTNRSMTLPNGLSDNSDTVVVGQNTLRSITCIIDGQSIIIWQGTPCGQGITYYLPKVTHFSADIKASKGQHNLQVDVTAVSEYVTEGILPFAQRTYAISAKQSTTFYLSDDSDSTGSPTIDKLKSSYEIWPSSTVLTPQTLTPTPTQFSNPTANPQSSPTWDPTANPTARPQPIEVNETTLTAIVIAVAILSITLGSLGYFKKNSQKKSENGNSPIIIQLGFLWFFCSQIQLLCRVP